MAVAFEAQAATGQVVRNDDGTVTVTVCGSGSDKLGSGFIFRQHDLAVDGTLPWCNAWHLFDDDVHNKAGRLQIALRNHNKQNTLTFIGAANPMPTDASGDLKTNGGGTDGIYYDFTIVTPNPSYYISAYSVKPTPSDETAVWKINDVENYTVATATTITKSFDAEATDRSLFVQLTEGSGNLTLSEFTVTLTPNPAMSVTKANQQLTAYLAPYITSLKAIDWVSDQEAEAAFSSLTITEQEGVEDYAEALETAKAGVNDCVYAVVKEKIAGKKFYILSKASTPQYIKGNASGNILHAASSDISSVWTAEFSDTESTVKFYNPCHSVWANGLQVGQSDAVSYALDLLTFSAGYFGIKNPAQSGNNYWNDNQNGGIRYWTCASGNTSSFFKFVIVETWPVAIHADGYGSIVSPFTVAAPEGCTTYAIKVDDAAEKVSFDEIEAGESIPAGTHALIYGGTSSVTTVSVPVWSCEVENTTAHTSLVGHHLAKTIAAEAGKNYFAKTEAPMQDVMTLSTATPMKLVKLDAVDGQVTVPAGAVVLALPADKFKDDVLSINPNEGVSTLIAEIDAEAAGEAVYDLQGRRQAALRQGLNIVGGKVVLVK